MISVIIPTYNREDCLFNTLESFDEQKCSVDFEILVIDQSENPSNEKIERILKVRSKVHYYRIDRAGRSIAKNAAIPLASGQVLLFCDDDIIAESNFLDIHWNTHLSNPDIGAMSCHLIEKGQEEVNYPHPLKITNYGRFINVPNSTWSGYVTSLNGGNMSFKKVALDKAGFFEEVLVGTSMLEEPDIAHRILMNGYKIYFSAATKVKHFPQHNGNLSTQAAKEMNWTKNYFFNQYYFLFRNYRKRFIPLVFIYLSYRSALIFFSKKGIQISIFGFPVCCLLDAASCWNKLKYTYTRPWYTPLRNAVSILQYKSN